MEDVKQFDEVAVREEVEGGLSGLIQDAVKERVKQIAQDMERKCEDYLRESKRAFITDAMLLYDCAVDLSKMQAALVRDCLESLERAGVHPYSQGTGSFDPSRQKVIRIRETADETLVNTVAQAVRCGFVSLDGCVIRPEEVVVYKKLEVKS